MTVFYLAGSSPCEWSKELPPLLLAGVKEEGEKCSDLVQILPGSRGEPDEFVVY